MSNPLLRDTHRWLGLIAGVQLLLWTVSGLYFTLIPIETIRGNHLLVDKPDPALLVNTNLISPSDLVRQHAGLTSITFEVLAEKHPGQGFCASATGQLTPGRNFSSPSLIMVT